MFHELNDSNFLLYCAKNYNNIHCHSTDEFLDDLKRIKYIKKTLTKYKTTGIIDDRLVLNHLIILNNMFGPEVLCRIIFLKMEKYLELIKPFLLSLNLLPTIIYNIKGQNINTDTVSMDAGIINKLRRI